MNNEELKKKICKIIAPYVSAWGEDERIADALITAWIGDVKEAEMAANRYEMLYKMQSRDMALSERKTHEAEHRAEVAERALRIVAKEVPCDEWCPFSQKCNVELNGENGYQCCFDEYLRQAEKELAEEKKDGSETD